ncbi:MAG: hypothetical protein D6799_01245 [Bacteroidetes bacterium]|nr:MAG: hypothetical protein D6799_01245 [Bacteroidota bacterium]
MFKNPWTNGTVGTMNKKIKKYTGKKYHYEDIDQLKNHLYYYLPNYNFNLKLRALRYKTPYESMEEWYQKSPEISRTSPNHLIVGLNN